MSDILVSGTSSPYISRTYAPASTDKNSLKIESYYKLLAAQMQHQDATNPMDNSEMLAQMTQMAMIQSITDMTEAMATNSAINTQTYAASLMGQGVTVAVTETDAYGQSTAAGVKYGKVESVNLTGPDPLIRLEGDDTEYPLSYVLGMGELGDPFRTGEGIASQEAVNTAGVDMTDESNTIFDRSLLD